MPQTYQKFLNGKSTIFQRVTTRRITSLYKLKIYYNLANHGCVAEFADIHDIHF